MSIPFFWHPICNNLLIQRLFGAAIGGHVMARKATTAEVIMEVLAVAQGRGC